MSGLDLTGQLIAPLPPLNHPVGVKDVGQLSLSLGRLVGVKGRGWAHQQKGFSARRAPPTKSEKFLPGRANPRLTTFGGTGRKEVREPHYDGWILRLRGWMLDGDRIWVYM